MEWNVIKRMFDRSINGSIIQEKSIERMPHRLVNKDDGTKSKTGPSALNYLQCQWACEFISASSYQGKSLAQRHIDSEVHERLAPTATENAVYIYSNRRVVAGTGSSGSSRVKTNHWGCACWIFASNAGWLRCSSMVRGGMAWCCFQPPAASGGDHVPRQFIQRGNKGRRVLGQRGCAASQPQDSG